MSPCASQRLMATTDALIGEHAELHTRMYAHAHTYARTRVHIQTHTLTHQHSRIYNHTHSYIDTKRHTHTNVDTHTHKHTDTKLQAIAPSNLRLGDCPSDIHDGVTKLKKSMHHMERHKQDMTRKTASADGYLISLIYPCPLICPNNTPARMSARSHAITTS